MPDFYYGFDTSNYTTSCAVCFDDGSYRHERQLLPLASGEKGIRQSNAVFYHTRALPGLFHALTEKLDGKPAAVGCSVSPRDSAESYMPCFLVGETAASVAADVAGVPLYRFSHQAGHVAAAALTCSEPEILNHPFLSFHVSGGTTDLIHAEPDDETVIRIQPVVSSLDLKAGQAVDRVGLSLGLDFPAGPALERLAAQSVRSFRPAVFLRDGCASFSGLENQCGKMLQDGESACDIAKFCLSYIAKALLLMTDYALSIYPGLPVLFAGGVMSDLLIRAALAGIDRAKFAKPELSSDNAVGAAYLAMLAHRRRCGE